MTKQSKIFTDGEAEEWFARNQDKLPNKDDPVIDSIVSARIKPRVILEVGCSNGWRVKMMQKQFGCAAYGIDPLFKNTLWNCIAGTADDLAMFTDNKFDVLIYGWCLYLCDREDLFKIVSEGDRVLQEDGYLIIYDFHVAKPYRNKYKHKSGLYSYKMDYSQLWLANPNYHLISRLLFDTGDNRTSISILRKSIRTGWPLHD